MSVVAQKDFRGAWESDEGMRRDLLLRLMTVGKNPSVTATLTPSCHGDPPRGRWKGGGDHGTSLDRL